jgi:hypothetical protein
MLNSYDPSYQSIYKLQNQLNWNFRFEVLTAVTVRSFIFLDTSTMACSPVRSTGHYIPDLFILTTVRTSYQSKFVVGRAIARAVNGRLPTPAARVQSHVKSCGFYGGQRGTGTGFLRVLQLPLPILIPPTAPQSSIIRGWYNRPNSGRRTKFTQSHFTPPKN